MDQPAPFVTAIGTASPGTVVRQEEAREFARGLFAETHPDIDRLIGVFANTLIEQREFAVAREWFTRDRSFTEKNEAYVEAACRLGAEATRRCLETAGLAPREVDHLIFVSTTGISTPSIDAHLFNILGMDPHLRRTPIWGLGCAGGVSGLARALDYARAYPGARVLLLAVELCSLTFIRNDLSKSNFVACALFSDGAAAALVSAAPSSDGWRSPRLLDSMSTIFPESLDVMGWALEERGLKVLFSRDIPAIVSDLVRPNVEEFLARHGLCMGDVAHFITHPGGAKVMAAYEEALCLTPEKLRHARKILRTRGNMSSCTVLHVLKEFMRDRSDDRPKPGEYGLVTALGPGFSSELVLLQW